jgi:enamine deaminase RidA (YjgF/YER057c/UK114 family)
LFIVTSTLTPFVNFNVGINLASLFKMSGRGGRNNGRGGRGRGSTNRGGRSRGRGQNYTGSANAVKMGLCTNLGTTVFDYGQKSAADQMRTSWGKFVQYLGTSYGQDINNVLQNTIWVVLTEPVHTDDVLARHIVREVMIRNGQLNIQQARQAQETILKAAVQAGTYMDAQNEIAQVEFTASIEVPVVLTDSEKTQFSNDWRTCWESNAGPQ